MPLAAPSYRADIDGLRGLAVLCVVVFHAFPASLPGGFVGVDVFFVISGFLITTQILAGLRDQTFSLADFYARRIRRLLPALLLVLGCCLLFGWFALLPDEYEQLGKQVTGASLFVSNVVLLFETGYFDYAAETKPLLHLWSLGIEEQFYLVWPLALACCRGSRLRLGVLFAVAGVLSFGLNVAQLAASPEKVFYLPMFRFWELALGGALACRHFAAPAVGLLGARGRFAAAAAVVGLLAIVGAALYLSQRSAFPGWWALLPAAGTCLLIASGPGGGINRALAHRWLVGIGLISYPLYLWHWPLLSFLRVTQGSWPSPSLAAAAVALAFVLATLTFLAIERPLRAHRHRRGVVTGLLLGLVTTGLLGVLVWQQGGLPARESVAGMSGNRSELTHILRIDEACRRAVPVADIQFDYCRYREAGSGETVAIIGDSHARVAFPGIADLLAAHGVNTLLMANSSCPPLAGTPSAIKTEAPGPALGEETARCAQKIAQIYAVLATKPEIRKVFLISRGAIYLTGQGFGEPERGVARAPIIDEAAFRRGLRRTIEALHQQQKKVYLVLENPETGLDPSACLDRPFKFTARSCGLDLKAVLARQATYLQLFADLKGATVIPTLPAFCPQAQCQLQRNGQLLYADDDHLSVAGSVFQAEEILRPWLLE